MRTKEFKLSEVHVNNELNRVTKELLQQIEPQLKKYVGKKISTQSGKSKRFVIRMIIPNVTPVNRLDFARVHYANVTLSAYSLWLKVSICFNGGSYSKGDYYCYYKESDVYLGTISGHTLTELAPVEYSRFDPIDAEEQEAYIREYNELIKKVEELNSKIKI